MALTEWSHCPECESTAVNATVYSSAEMELECTRCGMVEVTSFSPIPV